MKLMSLTQREQFERQLNTLGYLVRTLGHDEVNVLLLDILGSTKEKHSLFAPSAALIGGELGKYIYDNPNDSPVHASVKVARAIYQAADICPRCDNSKIDIEGDDEEESCVACSISYISQEPISEKMMRFHVILPISTQIMEIITNQDTRSLSRESITQAIVSQLKNNS